MKYILTVTKDTVAEEAQRAIMLYENENTAKRAWGNGINLVLKQGNPDNIPVSDLELWKIAEFDTQTMEITACKEFICSGAQFVVNFVPTHTQEIPKPQLLNDEEIKGE